jgi:hypothetical protein
MDTSLRVLRLVVWHVLGSYRLEASEKAAKVLEDVAHQLRGNSKGDAVTLPRNWDVMTEPDEG